jgi:hypothetical protein
MFQIVGFVVVKLCAQVGCYILWTVMLLYSRLVPTYKAKLRLGFHYNWSNIAATPVTCPVKYFAMKGPNMHTDHMLNSLCRFT